MDRLCTKCRRKIVAGMPGDLCLKCKLDETSESDGMSLYNSGSFYDVIDISQKLGLSEAQVRRIARKGEIPGKIPGIKRHLFDKKTVDNWIERGRLAIKTPTSPIQEKAYAMCKRNDHSWMEEEEYEGNSYLSESHCEMKPNSLVISYTHTCYFCGKKLTYSL